MWQSVSSNACDASEHVCTGIGSFILWGSTQGLLWLRCSLKRNKKPQPMRHSLVHTFLLAGLRRSAAQSSRSVTTYAAARRKPFVSHLDAAKMAHVSDCIDLTLSSDSGSPEPARKGTCISIAYHLTSHHTAPLPVGGTVSKITTSGRSACSADVCPFLPHTVKCVSLARHQPCNLGPINSASL